MDIKIIRNQTELENYTGSGSTLLVNRNLNAESISTENRVIPIPKGVIVSSSLLLLVLSIILVVSLADLLLVTLFSRVAIPDIINRPLRSSLQFILMGLVSYLYLKRRQMIDLIHNLKYDNIFTIAASLLVMSLILMVSVIYNLIIHFSGIQIADHQTTTQIESQPEIAILYVFVMILLVGPIEEFLFRGVIQGVVRKYYTIPIAIFVSSVLFGLAHIAVGGSIGTGGIVYAILAFFIGLLLGVVYELTESLIIVAVAHALYNTLMVILTVVYATIL